MKAHRIALIHATTLAMDPIRAAFAQGWPGAELMNLLDDALTPDRARSPDLGPDIRRRIAELAHYAHRAGADAILFTCSAFGEAIEDVAQQLPIPVLKPNEAMFEAAVQEGSSIGMLATFAPAIPGMEAEFEADAKRLNPAARLRTIAAPDAMTALRGGDRQEHDRLVAAHVRDLGRVDAIILAQFSMAPAAAAVRRVTDAPVFTSPDAAVSKLKSILANR